MALIYLATPYSDDDPKVEKERFLAVNLAAGYLIKAGRHVFSPISHFHPIKEVMGLSGGWEYWKEYDEQMISCCSEVIVLMLDGWDESVGVEAEMKIAGEQGKPVTLMTLDMIKGLAKEQ